MLTSAHGAATLSGRSCCWRAATRQPLRALRLAWRARGITTPRSSASDAAAHTDEELQALFIETWQAAGALPATPPVSLSRTALGRGLVVRGAALEAGGLVVSLPWSSVISVSDGDTAEGPADARLARALLAATADGGGNALWRRYAALLPAHTGAAALWTSELVEELQLPAAVDSAQGARLHFRTQAARLGAASTQAALWALGMVHSRSFALSVAGKGRVRLLAPLADLINNEQASAADATSGDDAAWSLSDGRFELRAPRRFLPGEEVLMFYGHETTAELLISYGFAPSPNAADYVPLYGDLRELLDDDRWTAREPARVTRAKAAMLFAGDAARAPLAVRCGGIQSAAHLLGCLRVVHADAADVAHLEERPDAAVGHVTWQWRDDAATGDAAQRRARADAAALAHAAARAQEVLEEMPTTLSEDAEQLRQPPAQAEEEDDADGAAALLAAVSFRAGVKQLLTDFIAAAACEPPAGEAPC